MSLPLDGPMTFFDVETTGLSSSDRIVSLGLIHIKSASELRNGDVMADARYLIFNPGVSSDPRAQKVHGFSDEILSIQDRFDEYATHLFPFFNHGGPIIAHNVSFDRRFITRAFSDSGLDIGNADFQCTMLAHRRKFGAPSGLDAVIRQAGLPRREGYHGALQDAALSLSVYCWLNGWPVPREHALPTDKPTNFRREPKPGAPSPSYPAHAVNLELSDAYAASFETLQPLATVMMKVAKADGIVYDEEIEAISLLMHTVLSGMPGKLQDFEYQELLSALVDCRTDSHALRAACRMILRKRELRESVAGWIKVIAWADGGGSVAEQQAIQEITEAMQIARV